MAILFVLIGVVIGVGIGICYSKYDIVKNSKK